MGHNVFGSTAFAEVFQADHNEIVELLLKAGAHLNIVDPSRMNDCELSAVYIPVLKNLVLRRNKIKTSHAPS